ncbi:MAG: hypothetical protein ACNS61_06785 [Candidatus Wenzhouxiangella sp. M2_3B_020]
MTISIILSSGIAANNGYRPAAQAGAVQFLDEVRTGRSGHRFGHRLALLSKPAQEKRFRGNVFALKLENRRNGLEIGPDTPIPLWNGESMDYGMAVEGLLVLEQDPRQTTCE